MPIPKEISISYSAKMSRNYQSADCSVSITLEILPSDDIDAVQRKWHDQLKTFVHNQLRKDIAELTQPG